MRPWRTGRGRVGPAVLALVLLVAAGCATVPTSGPVQFQAYGPGEQPEDAEFEIMNVAPEPGDSARQIVRGFLETMLAYQPEHPMARGFLTPKAQAEWQPGRRILVYEAGSVVPGERKNTVFLTGTKIGNVGEDRAWRAARPGVKAQVEFRLKEIDGEWRIDQVPNLVFMKKSNFEREFEPYDLYFYDPQFEILVPDPVYLPERGDEATTLVSAVLEGPTNRLEPVVRTVASPDTRLQVPSVDIEGQTARVEFNEPVRELTKNQRELLAAQLAWTLGQVTEVTRIRLLVDRVPLDVFGDSTDTVSRLRKYDPAVAGAVPTGFVLHENRLFGVDEGGLTPRPPDLPELDYVPETYAVGVFPNPVRGPKQTDPVSAVARVTLVGEDGQSLWMYGGQRELGQVAEDFDFHQIVSLSWDRTGQLWVVDQENGDSRIVLVDQTGGARILAVPGLSGENVSELRVSRDGTMVAAVVERDDEPKDRSAAYVGLIEREKVPMIRDMQRLATGYADVSDIAWSDPAEVVVVGEDSDLTSQIAEVRIDGSWVDPVGDAPAAPVEVAAAPGRPLILVDAEGDVYVEEDRQAPWRSLGQAEQPVYAG